MGVSRTLFKKEIETYTSIDDLPIYNWFKINETNDLGWLIKNREDVKYADDAVLKPIWDVVYKEFFDTFGMPEKVVQYWRTRKEIALMQCDMIINDDRSLQTFIDIKNLELEELLRKEESETTFQVKAHVEKFMGFQLNDKVTSVKDFYGYVSLIKAEQQKATQTKSTNGEND